MAVYAGFSAVNGLAIAIEVFEERNSRGEQN
jgi:hypothetical protein